MNLNRYKISVSNSIRGRYSLYCKECDKIFFTDMPLRGTFIPLIDTVKPIEDHEEEYHGK